MVCDCHRERCANGDARACTFIYFRYSTAHAFRIGPASSYADDAT